MAFILFQLFLNYLKLCIEDEKFHAPENLDSMSTECGACIINFSDTHNLEKAFKYFFYRKQSSLDLSSLYVTSKWQQNAVILLSLNEPINLHLK